VTSVRMIRVLLADDHAIVLEGLRALLDGEPGLRVVAATTDGSEVVRLVEQHKPDVVVLDLELAGMKGTAVLAALRVQRR
jgi:DNA-binding NarL/FixJ family response regulator